MYTELCAFSALAKLDDGGPEIPYYSAEAALDNGDESPFFSTDNLPPIKASEVRLRFTAGGVTLLVVADKGRWRTASGRGRGIAYMQHKHHEFLKEFVIPVFLQSSHCKLTRAELLDIRWPDFHPAEVEPQPAEIPSAIPF